MNLSPKADFLKTDSAKKLADLVAASWFQNALTVGLAQMVMDLGAAENPSKGWDAHSQVAGAKRYIHTLLNLPDPRIIEKPKLSSDLDFKASSTYARDNQTPSSK